MSEIPIDEVRRFASHAINEISELMVNGVQTWEEYLKLVGRAQGHAETLAFAQAEKEKQDRLNGMSEEP